MAHSLLSCQHIKNFIRTRQQVIGLKEKIIILRNTKEIRKGKKKN